uniref:Uncharacterized protein n=1 Tax=viral metagenome TaxID=1070528 RepID=A0A6M3JT64_9ZZZZ
MTHTVDTREVFQRIIQKLQAKIVRYKSFSLLSDLNKNYERAAILQDIVAAIESSLEKEEK